MNPATSFERVDRVITREIAGETLLVPIRDDAADMHHIFVLNPVGALIWSRLGQAATVDELVASVCSTFEEDEEQVVRDVRAFLDELREADLVRET